jgi:hypothetical protein
MEVCTFNQLEITMPPKATETQTAEGISADGNMALMEMVAEQRQSREALADLTTGLNQFSAAVKSNVEAIRAEALELREESRAELKTIRKMVKKQAEALTEANTVLGQQVGELHKAAIELTREPTEEEKSKAFWWGQGGVADWSARIAIGIGAGVGSGLIVNAITD